jgi:hypothetical protein
MPVTVDGRAATAVTLATTLLRVEGSDGLPRSGDWLEVTWPSASQDAANLVRVRLGDGDDGDAVAATDPTIAPGSAYRALYPIGGCAPVCVAGSSAFSVTIRVL